jgi:hypothetical protein
VPAVRRCALPEGALLQRYAGPGGYADCYVAVTDRAVSHAEFVEGFYTTALFKIERMILKLLASRPSTDAQAAQLADGTLASFAAWSVESRAPNQLLLADFTGRTRSWLMVAPPDAGSSGTRLYFGSAVVRARKRGPGLAFAALLGFHKLYSRLLLGAARSRLSR